MMTSYCSTDDDVILFLIIHSAKMPLSQELTEKLINLISENPVLYDARRKDYKDVVKNQNVWESISQVMGMRHMKGLYISLNAYDSRRKSLSQRMNL